jgi:hypothetical protein
LLWLAATQPNLVLGRSAQVALWNRPDAPAALATSLIRSLGMFNWRGDWIWRHNVPGRPVFDPLLGIVFWGGAILGLARWRERPALALALIWLAAMLLPTILADDAPHFLRAVGILPAAILIAALGLDAGLERAGRFLTSRALPPFLAPLGAVALLVVGAVLTARDYFSCRAAPLIPLSGFDYAGCYGADPVRGYFFQAQATMLAEEVNAAQGTLLLDRRYEETFPSLRFLTNRDDAIRYAAGEHLAGSPPPLTLFAWPHADLETALNALPPQAQIEVAPGPLSRGDSEPAPYVLYVRFAAAPLDGSERREPLARFENGLILLDAQTVQTGDSLTITLRWQTDAPQTTAWVMFLHAVGNDGQIAAQVDEPPGTRYYPSLSWRPGGVIIQPISLSPIPPGAISALWLGLYEPASGDRVAIVATGLPQQENALSLPLPEGEGG